MAEYTGILFEENNSTIRVIGSRQIVIVDGRGISHSNIANIKERRPFTVTDVKIHVLGSEYEYDLENHQVILPEKLNLETDLIEPGEEQALPYIPTEEY